MLQSLALDNSCGLRDGHRRHAIFAACIAGGQAPEDGFFRNDFGMGTFGSAGAAWHMVLCARAGSIAGVAAGASASLIDITCIGTTLAAMTSEVPAVASSTGIMAALGPSHAEPA